MFNEATGSIMRNKLHSLLFKFAFIFCIFSMVALSLTGITAYINQREIYKEQCEEHLINIAHHLEHLVEAEGQPFYDFQQYYIDHKDSVLIRHDFNGDWMPDYTAFTDLMHTHHPNQILGKTIAFPELDEEVKMAYTVYMAKKWLSIFEGTAKSFSIHYAYYLVPSKKPLNMYWVIDAVREERFVDGIKYIDTCTEVEEPLERHQKMWGAWSTGKEVSGYDTYDNEYGKTYAYYTAVHLNGVKAGIVGTEIDIADVDSAILENTLIQLSWIGVILGICVVFLLIYIYERYIKKLERLQQYVRSYTENKDASIAKNIEDNAIGKDEIADLSMQTSAMILELENYMNILQKTIAELGKEKKRADTMKVLATKDALTGINNKTAYDNEIRRLEWSIEDKTAEFAIGIFDLNFLKRINDTYGHEQGNMAIKKLCHIVCEVFKKSPVFRIGGDEFVVILEHEDYKNCGSLVKAFRARLNALAADTSLKPWERTSAALGIAKFDPAHDASVTNVFKRADRAMYTCKKEMNAIRE